MEGRRDGERDVGDGGDQSVSRSRVQRVVRRNNQPTHHVCQSRQSMHLQEGKRVKYELGRKEA